MASEFVDLVSQVQNVLPLIRGGTGNGDGLAVGTIISIENRSGSTIPLYSALGFNTNGDAVPTTLDSQVPVIGILAGTMDGTGVYTMGDSATDTTMAVLVSGVTGMIFDTWDDSGNGIGEYVYTSAANAGHVYAKLTRNAGAIGLLLSSTRSAGAGDTLIAYLWSGTALAGPLVVTQEGTSVNPQSDAMDFAKVLIARAYANRTAVDIAPEWLGGLVAGQIAAGYGATGTTTIRPTSDAYKVGTITYTSGTTGWNLVNGAAPNPAVYYELVAGDAGILHTFTDPGLDFTYRIDSVTINVYRFETLGGSNGQLGWRDPGTGEIEYVGDFVPSTGYITWVFTTRPWDSRPWTIGDLPALTMGVRRAGRIEQVYIDIGWTKIVSVGSELAGIWRPLLTSTDAIVTAGAGGEAVMGFGPP